MRDLKLFIAMFLIGLMALLFPVFTRANAAPEEPPDGKNINPGEGTTMVQMVKEEILIDVGLTREVFLYYDEHLYFEGNIVAYNCTYWMVNQGTETEHLGVRFPLNAYYEIGSIDIHSIKVNDQPVPWVEDDANFRYTEEMYNWAHFDAVFPPGEEVEIKITYTSHTCPYYPCSVNYILETGAGWYGPIEQGRIILRLPYQATSLNVFVDDYESTEYPFEYSFSDSDIYWDFTDLEPTADHNFYVRIVEPDLWLDMLAEWDRLEESPNNTSALYRLADHISRATISDWGDRASVASASLYEEGLEAIVRAVRLNPEDVESHELYILYLKADETMENLLIILDEVDIILELDPENENVERIRNFALRSIESYQTATARAIATATNAPTDTPVPTATPTSTATATSTTTPTPTSEPVQESPPAVAPNQSSTLEVKEDTRGRGIGVAYSVILVSIGGILLVFGGLTVRRAVNKKEE